MGETATRPDGELLWALRQGHNIVRTYGTLSRRAALNAYARQRFGELFPPPQGRVVDWEALTAALPADYSHDGEHWFNTWNLRRYRQGAAYGGKSMAANELGNVLANLLCADTEAGRAERSPWERRGQG